MTAGLFAQGGLPRRGFLWRSAQSRAGGPGGGAALAVRPGGDGLPAAGWIQRYRDPHSDGATMFVIGSAGDTAVCRLATAMFRRGWSLDICGDAEAALASLASRPERWAFVAVFLRADDATAESAEIWDELGQLLPRHPAMRLHLNASGGVVRVDLANPAHFPRGLTPR